ncbi:MAG: (2Fe-2S) ferredoxin domain-containing protein [Nitriliruptorales bacterium]
MRAGQPRKHVFVCINERPADHPRGSCTGRGSAAIFNALRETVGDAGLVDIKVTFSGCMEPCMVGPVVYVAPDDVWYGGVTPEDIPRIVEEHLVGDEPVEFLRIGEEEFELSPLEGRADLPPGMIPPAS